MVQAYFVLIILPVCIIGLSVLVYYLSGNGGDK